MIVEEETEERRSCRCGDWLTDQDTDGMEEEGVVREETGELNRRWIQGRNGAREQGRLIHNET